MHAAFGSDRWPACVAAYIIIHVSVALYVMPEGLSGQAQVCTQDMQEAV